MINLLRHMGNSYFGHGTDRVPATLALGFGLPGLNATNLGTFSGLIRKAIQWTTEPYIYHFPVGNTTIARLLLRSLVDGVASGSTMHDVVTAVHRAVARPAPPRKMQVIIPILPSVILVVVALVIAARAAFKKPEH